MMTSMHKAKESGNPGVAAKPIPSKREAEILSNLGNAKLRKGDFESALGDYERVLAYAEKAENKQLEGACHLCISNCKQRLGRAEEALPHSRKALVIEEERGDIQAIGCAYGDMGNVHEALGDYKRSLEFHLKHLKLAQDLEDKEKEELVETSISRVMEKLEAEARKRRENAYDENERLAGRVKKSPKELFLKDVHVAEEMKTKGNNDLMSGKQIAHLRGGEELLASACKWYAKALEVVPLNREVSTFGQECIEIKSKLHTSLLLNLALASILCKEWDTVLNCTGSVLEKDPNNTKALYRATRAYLEMGDIVKAVEHIRLALKLAPKNKEIRTLAEKAEEAYSRMTREAMMLEEETLGICHNTQTLLQRAEISLSSEFFSKGCVFPNYAWGQTKTLVIIYVPFPCGLPSQSINCEMARTYMDIVFARHPTASARQPQAAINRFAGDLVGPIISTESTWMVEVPGLLHIELQKDLNHHTVWWPSIFMEDPAELWVDTSFFGENNTAFGLDDSDLDDGDEINS